MMETLHIASKNGVKKNQFADKHAHIQGWGVDLDHANQPAYPTVRMPARLDMAHKHPPVQQLQIVEILTSIERPPITPLFGTPQQPSV